MAKYCKKCGKEISESSKGKLCANCRARSNGKLRAIGGAVTSVALGAGSLALMIVSKGKFGGKKL